MTNPKRRTQRTRRQRDEAEVRVSIHQRVAVDLRAAALEIAKMPKTKDTKAEIARLNVIGRNIKVIHNRYSRVKQS